MNYFIAVDWGSSSFRAYLIQINGKVIDSIKTNDGIFNLKNITANQFLTKTCANWLTRFPGINFLLSGMVGSTRGITEVPYLSTPIELNQIGHHLKSLHHNQEQDKTIFNTQPSLTQFQTNIVPGICYQSNHQTKDVMRGEEVQILGASLINPIKSGIICLPGTHSKWVVIENHQITQITSFVSGEFFSALQSFQSLQEFPLNKVFQKEAFIQGVQLSLNSDGLLNAIFSSRVQMISGGIKTTDLYSYLSGMTIGAEIIAIKQKYQQLSNCFVVANQALQKLYVIALSLININCQQLEPDTCYAKGALKIAEQNNFFSG